MNRRQNDKSRAKKRAGRHERIWGTNNFCFDRECSPPSLAKMVANKTLAMQQVLKMVIFFRGQSPLGQHGD